MKKTLTYLMLCVMLCGMTGCSANTTTDTSSVVEESTTSTVNKTYESAKFADMPESISESYTGDLKNIQIMGYLSSSVSKDGSTGYLWNTGYGTTPNESAVGVCVVLDMTDAEKIDDIIGDQFVTVAGTIVQEDYYDVFNNKSAWHLDVDTISICDTLPEKVQQYEDYMESFEWEAFAQTIDFVGNAIYMWQEDENLVELDLELLECDIEEAQSKTKELYPEIYNSIYVYLSNFKQYYNTVVENMNNKTRPENLEELYTAMYDTYVGLSDDLVLFGCFE